MSSTTHQIADEMDHTRFAEIVQEGTELNTQLWLNILGLDTLMRSKKRINDGETYQMTASRSDANTLNVWTLRDTTRTAFTACSAVSKALGDLFRDESARLENFTLHPLSYSLQVEAIQDRDYFPVTQPSSKLPSTGARVEAVYNLIDGYIILTNIQMPNISDPAYNPRGATLAELVWAVWVRVHKVGKLDTKPGIKGEERVNARTFEIPDIGCFRFEGFRDCLKYILFQVPHDKEVMDVIRHCLFHNNVRGTNMPSWESRVTFEVGHWAYFALLGTFIGQTVVDLLATRKDVKKFGHKIIKSITLFAGDAGEHFTDDERKHYATDPIILFEVADIGACQDAGINLRGIEIRESKWSQLQANGERKVIICDIKDPQIGPRKEPEIRD